MRIAVGSDHRGVAMRMNLIDLLGRFGHEPVDVGTHQPGPVDYPDIAAAVARELASGRAERGVLICGTGLGVCIAANKFRGVRAAPCHDEFTAEISRRHFDVNVLCLPSDHFSVHIAMGIVRRWLETEFEGARHARRVEKITAIDDARCVSGGADGRDCRQPTAAGGEA
ncbi:MAG: ribose 5-phosphate isomerase B [Thermoguttaceae bacterium]